VSAESTSFRAPAEEQNKGPFDAEAVVQPTVDLFNAGHIPEATKSLRRLEEDARRLENDPISGVRGAWRSEIEILNSKVDLGKLNLKDAGQILWADSDGQLRTASRDLSKKQVRAPSDPSLPISESSIYEPEFSLSMASVPISIPLSFQIDTHPSAVEQVQRVAQYDEDVVAGRAMTLTPNQMSIHDDIKPIVDDFQAGRYKAGVAKLADLQHADTAEGEEPQRWLRHIEAVNAHLDLKAVGINDAAQLFGVDDKGNLLTVSPDSKQMQIRRAEEPQKILAQAKFNGEAADQVQKVGEIQEEANTARLEHLGPGLHHLSLTSDGQQREHDVYVGKHYNPNKPAPVYFIFHSAGPPPERGMDAETQANQWADEQKDGAIIVYALAEEHEQPVGKLKDGTFLGHTLLSMFADDPMTYHAYNSPGAGLNETRTSYDDTHNVNDIYDLLVQQVNVDRNAVYLIGFSDGTSIARQAAATAKFPVAGVGLMEPASMGTEAPLKPGSKTALIEVSGRYDNVLDAAGGSTYNGPLGNWERKWPRLALSKGPAGPWKEFAKLNGCSGIPQQHRLYEDSPQDMIRTEYTADQCITGHRPVVYIDLLNGEHAVNGSYGPYGGWLSKSGWKMWAGGSLTGRKITSYPEFSMLAQELGKYRLDSP